MHLQNLKNHPIYKKIVKIFIYLIIFTLFPTNVFALLLILFFTEISPKEFEALIFWTQIIAYPFVVFRYFNRYEPKRAKFLKFKSESILSFESIWQLDDKSLRKLTSQLVPRTLGLALCLVEVDKQKRVLNLISRDMAIKVFAILQEYKTSFRAECIKAQSEIIDLAVYLQYSGDIHFVGESRSNERSDSKNRQEGGKVKNENPHTEYHRVFDYRHGDTITRAELKKRYFSLMKKYHPDMWATGSMKEKIKSEKKTKKINLAYEYLSTLSD